MPELPDLVVYIEALAERIRDQPLLRLRIAHPFLLRTAEPPASAFEGKRVKDLVRIGKRIAVGVEGDYWLLIHLMIAGRLHWRNPNAPLRSRTDLAAFDFPTGSVVLSEAGTRKQASLHLVQNSEVLARYDPGGIEVLESDVNRFSGVLRSVNHTVKRALTDPRLFSGIGNAYSDEILFRACLSPAALTLKLNDEEVARLYDAARETLREWIERLRSSSSGAFPEKVSAFRKEMAVHGRYRLPCRVCGSPVQRIRYASNEANYCARCQTGGRLLADRSLSRLLKKDWPRTLEELEKRLAAR